MIIQRLAARSGTPLAEQIAAATGGKAETLMKSLLAAAAKRAADEAAPLKARIAAVEQLRLATFADRKGAARVVAFSRCRGRGASRGALPRWPRSTRPALRK